MTDMDYTIWQLVQNVIGTRLSEGNGEVEILEEIMRITHGIADYEGVRREIIRQKRMVVN